MSAYGTRVFVGVGANLGNPEAQVREAFRRLAEDLPQTRLTGQSRLYRNPPMGPPDQPDYVNAVVRLQTRLEPLDLLAGLQAIERDCGRRRDDTRWGPRLLDLDLLLFGEQVLDRPGLQVPHPGLAQRDFVVLPLAELAPGLRIPGAGSIEALARRFDGAGLVALEDPEGASAGGQP